MIKFVFQFLFIFILWMSNKKAKGNWLTSSSVLIGIYAVCAFLGIIELMIGDYSQPYEDRYWLPMLEFDFYLLLFLLPFRLFRESSIKKMVLPSKKILNIFSFLIIVLSFYSIIFFIGSVKNIFLMASLADARNAKELYFEAGINATIASVAAANYVFAIVLFFINEIIGGSKWKSLLLLLASLSEPIHVMSFVGRDGVVFWIFTFVFCYAFFRPYLPVYKTKSLLRSFIVIGSILLIPFVLISVSRFGDSDVGTGGSFVSYLGHAFIQGPLFFGLDNKPIEPGAVFPLFQKILGRPEIVSDGPTIIGDWVSYKFSTFVVSLYICLDLMGLALLLLFIYLLVLSTFCKAKRVLTFSQFVVYLLYFQIVGQGVFYFRHYTRGGNLFILTCLALAILFSVLIRMGKPVVIERSIKK